jgi:hypothetical protein
MVCQLKQEITARSSALHRTARSLVEESKSLRLSAQKSRRESRESRQWRQQARLSPEPLPHDCQTIEVHQLTQRLLEQRERLEMLRAWIALYVNLEGQNYYN